MRPVPKIITVAASAAFVLSSTAAAASAPAPTTNSQATAMQAQAPDAWMTLSMMSPASSVALGGASAAAQPTDVPPPPPPPEAGGGALGEGWAPVAVLGLWAILIVAALATSNSSGASNIPSTPNSPA